MNDIARTVLLVLLAVIAISLFWGIAMMGMMGPGMMDGWGGPGGWSPWQGFLTVIAIVFIAGGVAVLAWWAFGRAGGPAPSRRPGGDAHRILEERYARGEIPREQYEQMRRDIEP